VKVTLNETMYEILEHCYISEEFTIKRWLRQGDPLLTTLFNVILEKIVGKRESQLPTTRTIFSQWTHVITFADNIMILAKTKEKRTVISVEKKRKH